MIKFGQHTVRETILNGVKTAYLSDQLVVKLNGAHAKDPGATAQVMNRLPEGTRLESAFNRMGIGVFQLPSGADSLIVAQDLQQQEENMVEYAQPAVLHSGSPQD